MIDFAIGSGVRTAHWKQHKADSWEDFVAWLDLHNPASVKECGGYVAGLLQPTVGHSGHPTCVGLHRNSRAVVSRAVLTLDVDSARVGFELDVRLELKSALALHTTWSHKADAPRWRLLVPLDRGVSPREYRTLVAAVMDALGEEQFDPGSKEPERFMHRPSTQGAYRYVLEDGDPLDVDAWLLRAEDLGISEEVFPARAYYLDESPKREEPGLHPACSEVLDSEADKLAELGVPWSTGDGWDLATFRAACVVWELVNSRWTGLDEEAGLAWLLDKAPRDDVWGEHDHLEKWRSARDKVAGGGVPMPTDASDDFGAVIAWPELPSAYNDAYMAGWMAYGGLGGNWRWNGGLGWLAWTGKKWSRSSEEACGEAVRRVILKLRRKAQGADQIKNVSGLLSATKIKSIVTLMRGVVEKGEEEFDKHHDLLNVANGVVDLKTGELREHDRDLLMTRISPVRYVPGARDADWDQVLSCLEPEVMGWMQIRLGQAATGWATSDDVLPVGQGGGANGKSTLLAGLFAALGEHMVLVPEKLLRSYPGDHPTEMMTLLGARVAVIDETPEVSQLSVPKLKALLGQSRMVARAVYKNNVTWAPTHSLFLMTNYIPQVRETDHGTWRRLALVKYERKYKRDDAFRARVSGNVGTREAALAWVVEGSQRWYEEGQLIPEAPAKVLADTQEWQAEADQIGNFIAENLELDPGGAVLSLELLSEFNAWLRLRGQAPWADATLANRLRGSGLPLEKRQTRSLNRISRKDVFATVSDRPAVWRGLRWKDVVS